MEFGDDAIVERRAYRGKEVYVSLECGCDWEPFLREYLATQQSAATPTSRLDLIARLRAQTHWAWIDCRDLVDRYIAENDGAVIIEQTGTAREVFKIVFSNDGDA